VHQNSWFCLQNFQKFPVIYPIPLWQEKRLPICTHSQNGLGPPAPLFQNEVPKWSWSGTPLCYRRLLKLSFLSVYHMRTCRRYEVDYIALAVSRKEQIYWQLTLPHSAITMMGWNLWLNMLPCWLALRGFEQIIADSFLSSSVNYIVCNKDRLTQSSCSGILRSAAEWSELFIPPLRRCRLKSMRYRVVKYINEVQWRPPIYVLLEDIVGELWTTASKSTHCDWSCIWMSSEWWA
jgi:hypothetical protein